MPEIATPAHHAPGFEQFAVPLPQRVMGFPPPRCYGVGRVLCRQGDAADSVFLVERGLVKLIWAHPEGQNERIVGLRSDGWLIDAPAAIANEPSVASAVCAVPSRVALLPAAEFRRLLAENRAFAWRIHGMLAREVCVALEQLGEEVRPARERLKHLLHALAPAADGQPIVRNDLPLKQWEIAQLIGVRPQYLSALLRQLGLDGSFRGHGGGLRRTNGIASQEHRAALVRQRSES